ncbi:MAG: aspartate/glutamate racemase family protein, partial [Rhodobacterales bacterium]|nr:aspartate/glutamate racemase family protein [Rhodobacterales bacterium]
MALRCVGILGGMGPEATVLLMQKVIAAVPARDDADHVPLLVDQNPQVPSRIRHLIDGTGESPAPALVAMARRLTAAGAQALAMPCNTAHHYAPAIRAAVDLPFLDMVALSADRAAALAGPGGAVGI